MTLPDPTWLDDAACRGMDPVIFHPAQESSKWHRESIYDRARSICTTCPVADECLADALASETNAARFGMRGGLTPKERAELVRDTVEVAVRRAS